MSRIRDLLYLAVPALSIEVLGALGQANAGWPELANVGCIALGLTMIGEVVTRRDRMKDRLYARTAQLEREAGLYFDEAGLLAERVAAADAPPDAPALPSGGYVGRGHGFTPRELLDTLKHDEEVLQATRLALRGCHHVWDKENPTCVKCGAHAHSLIAIPSSFVDEPYPIEMVPRYMLPRERPHRHQWQVGRCRLCGVWRSEV